MPPLKSRTPSPAAGDGRTNSKLMASAIAAANRLSRSTVKKHKTASNPNPSSSLPAATLKPAEATRPASSEKRQDHGKGVLVVAPAKNNRPSFVGNSLLGSSSVNDKNVEIDVNKESVNASDLQKNKEDQFVSNSNSFVQGNTSSALVIYDEGVRQNPSCMQDKCVVQKINESVPYAKEDVDKTTATPRPPEEGPSSKDQNHVSASRLKPDKTFAQAAVRSYPKPPDVLATGLSAIPTVKQGTFVSFNIPDSIYKEQLHAFRFAIIGRLMLKKGETPRITLDLQEELTTCLKPVEKWSLINLGKGYFTLKFSCEEDLKKISHFSSYKLSSGVMFLREWKRGFDPYKEQSSVAQVWVRAYHLPAELWHPEVLAAVFREIGNLVKFDGNTMSGNSGHFARALVEVDLSQPLITSVMGGCSDGSLLIDLSFENLPLYCPYCNFVGHDIQNCRKKKAADKEDHGDSAQTRIARQQKEQSKPAKGVSEWVRKGQADRAKDAVWNLERGSENGLLTTNRFAVIAEDNEVHNMEDVALDKEDTRHNLDGEMQTWSDSSDSDLENNDLALRLAMQSMSKIPEGVSLQDHVARQMELELRVKRIRDILRRSRQNGAETAVGAKEFEDALVTLIEKGENISDFVIDPGDYVNTRTMSNMATKRWAEQVEEEEAGLLGDHQTP